MAWKEKSSIFFVFGENQEIEGIYVGREEIDLPGKDQKAWRYTMVLDEGAQVSFLGTCTLDRAFTEQAITPGARVKIRYDGSKEIPGKQPIKLFRVWVWEDDPDSPTPEAS